MRPLISIITVNYNNENGLAKTLESVKCQIMTDFEHIIIDAASKDGSMALICNYEDSIKNYEVRYVSENDDGIYDGMNKGILRSNGLWLYFLNSGDTLANCEVLSDLKLHNYSYYNVIYGKLFIKNVDTRPYIHQVLEYGLINASHQAMFIKNITSYDVSYKIYGDYELLARIYKLDPSRFAYINKFIAIRESGGVSSVISWRKRYEKLLATYKHFGLFNMIIGIIWRYIDSAKYKQKNV